MLQILVFSPEIFSANTPTAASPSCPGVRLAFLAFHVLEVTGNMEGFSVLGSGGVPLSSPSCA